MINDKHTPPSADPRTALLIECREVIEGLMKDLEMWPGDKNPEFFYSMKKARALLAKLEE